MLNRRHVLGALTAIAALSLCSQAPASFAFSRSKALEPINVKVSDSGDIGIGESVTVIEN